jgi:hypothetical protein
VTIEDLAATLREDTKWQETPEEFSYEDYENMVERAVKRLYIDTGRALEYSGPEDTDEGTGYTFEIDEEAYVLICAKLVFYDKVKIAYNTQVSYTTDALSVTGGDKPYANMKGMVEALENERRITFHKMNRYGLGGVEVGVE